MSNRKFKKIEKNKTYTYSIYNLEWSRNSNEIDHIFPKSKFKAKILRKLDKAHVLAVEVEK